VVACPRNHRQQWRRLTRDGAIFVRGLAKRGEVREIAVQMQKVAMLFAHLKRHLGFERLPPRGLSGARDEFLLAATLQDLRRLAGMAVRPATTGPIACAT
jgi:hypothetical protein